MQHKMCLRVIRFRDCLPTSFSAIAFSTVSMLGIDKENVSGKRLELLKHIKETPIDRAKWFGWGYADTDLYFNSGC